MNIEIECSPAEARAFLGLPDVTPINEQLVSEMQKRIEGNIAMLAPEELMKNWMAMGGQATDAFRQLMAAAVGGSTSR